MDESMIKQEILQSLMIEEMVHESVGSDFTDSAPYSSGTNHEAVKGLKHECLMDNSVKLGMNDENECEEMGNSFIEPSSRMISNLIVIAPQDDNFDKYELFQTNTRSYSPHHQEVNNQETTTPAVEQEIMDVFIKEEITEDVSEEEIDDQQIKGEILDSEENIKSEDDINSPWVNNPKETVKMEAQPAIMMNKMSEDRLQELLIKPESMYDENQQWRSCAPDLPDLLRGEMGIIQTDTGVWSTKFLRKGTEFGSYDCSAVSSDSLAAGLDWTPSLRKGSEDGYNMVAEQCGSKIIYKLVTDIQPQTELILLELKPTNNIDEIDTDSAKSCQEPVTSVITKQKHSAIRPHQCIECGKTFTQNVGLLRHMLTHSGEKAHVCTQCGKFFSQSGHLKTHMESHTKVKPFQCVECGNQFTRNNSLVTHMLTHMGEKPHQCIECGKAFAEKRGLMRHMLTHTGEKPHQCKQCGKFFSRPGNLKTHMTTHTKEKSFQCIECRSQFTRKDVLVKHMLTHSGAKPHECKQCGKFFSLLDSLKRHMLTHSGEKHECKHCGKVFSQSRLLKTHMESHTKEKLFQCIECGSQFTLKNSFVKHMHTHSGEKHECKQCGKFFSQSGNLTRHMLTHSGEKPHECKQCGKFFSQSGHLKQHMKSHQ